MAYNVGDTASISNLDALFTAFFSATPTNAAAPYCNTIEWAAYTDLACTTPFTGSATLPST